MLLALQIPSVCLLTDRLSGQVPAGPRRDESGTRGPGGMQLC